MTVGLTGGIGSGKTIVASLFEILGYPVFNSDEAAKEAYFNKEVKAKVEALLGKEAYRSAKELNKAFISSKIFSDTTLLQQLNAIIHPEVKKMFEAFARHSNSKIIIKESALLFEAGLDKQMDRIVMVEAPDELRISRVMKRDGLSRSEVEKKIKSQLSQEEKAKRSDYVIRNNEEEFLITQVLNIHSQLQAIA